MTFVKWMAGATAVGGAMLVGSGFCAPPAQAGYIVTLEQEGPNVVATGMGPIDLTGLSSDGSVATTFPGIATGFEGSTSLYDGFTGPTSFGSSITTFASAASGDIVGINTSGVPNTDLAVPVGYVSDSPLSDTATYDNATFSSLGVTPGTYEWKWGTGANQNFTLQIGAASVVPEPSSLVLLGSGLGLLGLISAGVFRRRSSG